MDRRTFAELLGALPFLLAPSAVAAYVLPPGKDPLYAVWSGLASIAPKDTDYTVVKSLTAFLNSMAHSQKDAGEASIIKGRVQDMQVGAEDEIRTDGINVDPDGNPGVIRIMRIR